MKFIKKAFVISLCFMAINTLVFATNQDVVFIVDLSKSMNQQNLFEKVKTSLKNYIQQSEIGDRIIIFGFGEDVTILVDKDIGKIEDLTNIMKKITNSKATEEWTYMTKALDLAARKIRDLQEAYPRRSKLIYLLTDGKNDPPPTLKEPPISFEDIINKYFEVYTKEGTYTYIVTYGVTPEAGLKKLADEIKIPISEQPRSPEKPLPAQIILSPKYIFKEVVTSDYNEIPIEISIDRIYLAKGVEMFFKLEAIDLPDGSEIGLAGKEKFTCESKGQEINFIIWIKNLLKEGTYKIKLIPETSDPSILIIPSAITITIKARYKEKPLLKIKPSYIKLKQKIKEEGYISSKFDLKFENMTAKTLLLLFSITSKDTFIQIDLSPDQIEFQPGKSKAEFAITGKNLLKKYYKFEVTATCPEEQVMIEPSKIELDFYLYTTADLLRKALIWLIPLIILLAVGLFIIYCRFLMPKFAGMYLLSGGLEFKLEDYRPFCSKKIILGKDIDFGFEEGGFAILKTSQALECLIKPFEAEKILVDGREIENEVPLAKGSIVRYKNIELTFQRREE